MVASDGTFTLQQSEQLDLNSLQLTTSNDGIFLPNLVTVKKKQVQECNLCHQIILDPSTEHICKVVAPPTKETPMFYCSFKKCGLCFETQTELEDHMQTYHQPPFSPAKQPSTAINVNKVAKKSVKFKVCVSLNSRLIF